VRDKVPSSHDGVRAAQLNRWATCIMLTVKTAALRWMGLASIAAAAAVSFVVSGDWLGIVLVWALFGALGLALVLMSATIEGSEEGITVRRVHSTAQIRWPDVIAASVGGGNLVLYSASGRVSMPSAEFWSGPQRAALQTLISTKLEGVGVTIRRTARAAMHADSRSPNKSLERTREK
jgi:hypothetical protein